MPFTLLGARFSVRVQVRERLMTIVEATNVSRAFAMPAGPVTAVRDITLRIAEGEHTAISGPSGCGKSTLLHMLGCVDTPSAGALLFAGQDVASLSDRA